MANDQIQQEVRVRIAPSPTGHLHVGTARSALFNWLFAKHSGGKFILRIEDTDLVRSKKEYEEEIIRGLKWLGLNWDEGPDIGGPYGPYRQTERKTIYKKYLQQLLDNDHAYYCSCTPEELKKKHDELVKLGRPPIYDGTCRAKNKKTGPGVIRFKIPEEKITFHDLIRGDVTFDGKLIGDIVIAKDIESPFYNVAVVIDDHEMKITHVIRGEEHLGNTPKQIFFHHALGLTPPIYAHAPLLLNKNRAKLSKRDAMVVGIEEYRKEGFLAPAIINFIALLGWHPQDDKEIMTSDELIQKFTIERVQKAGAIFDIEKLAWLNAHYIQTMDTVTLAKEMRRLYPELESINNANNTTLEQIIDVSKERLHTLSDIKEQINLFLEVPVYDPALLVWKKSTKESAAKNLDAIYQLLQNVDEQKFTQSTIENLFNSLTTTNGRGEVLWPLRVALSGRDASPGPYEIMSVIGKNETLQRIARALTLLK